MKDWWLNFLDDNQSEAAVLASELIDCPVGEVKDYLDEGQTALDWCKKHQDYDEIYGTFIGSERTSTDFGIDYMAVIGHMLTQAAPLDFDYEGDFIDEMVNLVAKYYRPDDFLRDLGLDAEQGMIPALQSDTYCKEIYSRNIDDMEAVRVMIEDEAGKPLRNQDSVRYATWICRLCYRVLCRQITSKLYPDQF